MASNEVAYVLESKSVIINAPIYQEEVHMPVGSRYPSFWCVPNWDNVIFWRLYEWYMLTLVLLIPFTVMSVAYFIICIKVWAVMKQRSGMSSSSGKPQESYRLTVYKGSRYQNSMRQTQMETKLVPSSNGVATSTRIKFTDDNSNLKQLQKSNKPKKTAMNGSKKNTKPPKRKTKPAESSNDEDYYCLFCLELYSNSRPRETWIKCVECSGWVHSDCTNVDKGCAFVCLNCASDVQLYLLTKLHNGSGTVSNSPVSYNQDVACSCCLVLVFLDTTVDIKFTDVVRNRSRTEHRIYEISSNLLQTHCIDGQGKTNVTIQQQQINKKYVAQWKTICSERLTQLIPYSAARKESSEHSFNGKGPTQYGKEDPRMYKEEDYGILIMIIHAQLNWEEKGIKIDGEFMSNLRFADDIFRNPRQIIRDAPTTIGRNYPNGIKNEHQKDKGACVENVEIKKYLDGLDENQRVRVKLATAYRSFDYFNLNEGICNHLSALAPAKSGNGTVMFLVPYGLHWSEVTPSKLVGVNDKFEVVEGDGQPEVSAMCIHKGIYAERKGTSSIMHSHPPYATALSLKKNTRVKPLHQSYMYFHNNIAYNHTFDGVVDTLVEGNRLGKVLKDKHTLMMGNHGVLVASDSIEKAFVLNYYLERICMFQILAESTGDELLEIPEKTIAQDATKIY
ncbi:putative aldolase class 2 protein [Nymphon striatum]|nr:putative aldolase class 2 protein [Nymphon striatum]